MEAFNTPAPAESEDCLHVNIFVPADAQTGAAPKPVMFWIYGGKLANSITKHTSWFVDRESPIRVER